jgi:regulator of RNase E activity RraA
MPVSKETLAIFRKVRTSDVADALDSMGLQERYEVDPAIRPLCPGIGFAGIASTAEYRILRNPIPPLSYEAFDDRQYKKTADGKPHPHALWKGGNPMGAPDEVVVIDCKRTRSGLLGSNNVLNAKIKGTVGFVIDGACRDSGECIIQRSPVFCAVRSPTHMAGRIELASYNERINCGGVAVDPGDVIIADDDGVMVVPQRLADEVADRADKIQRKDRIQRRAFYEKLGMPLDDTVQLD